MVVKKMNEGALRNSFNESLRLLKELSLVREFNQSRPFTFSMEKFSTKFIQNSQKNDYSLIYKIAMENRDYDILLSDDSFIQLSCQLDSRLDECSIRYAFFESPKEALSYSEFLEEIGFNELLMDEEENVFIEEYEQFKSESQLKSAVTPIRYDFQGKDFEDLIHPVSHLHIGFNNQVRIPINRVMTPLDFIIFILRNVYWKNWKYNIQQNEKFKEDILKAKRRAKPIEGKYFSDEEYMLYYMT